MTANEVLTAAIDVNKTTQAETAKRFGWTAQQLGQRMKRNSIRTDEFFGLMDILGIDVVFSVRATGEVLKPHIEGHGPRVVGMSDGVRYDTAMSEPIASSFFEDGVHEYGPDNRAQELYVDREGRYFLAEYTLVAGEKNRVRSVPKNVADAFREKYEKKLESVIE